MMVYGRANRKIILFIFINFLIVGSYVQSTGTKKPNIVFIVADDLGWNDVGWVNKDIKSPYLDGLAKEGLILNNSYVHHICSPSRASFMTGYYPFHTGLQDGFIKPLSPTGVPTKFKFLPQELKDIGYSTHAVGKWHLGFCSKEYTPLKRGFDTFLGFYTGSQDFFTHAKSAGFDFRNNDDLEMGYNGTYSTEIFGNESAKIIKNSDGKKPFFLYLSFQAVHDPLQVPDKYLDRYKNVKNKNRQIYSAMASAMDDAVGDVVNALKNKGIFDNTLIVFTTDNGGKIIAGGNNWPLRGGKGSMYEGGTRGVAFVHGKMLKTKGTVNDLIHASDWYPTLVNAAGGKPISNMDGIDQWPVFTKGVTGNRKEVVYNIQQYKNGTISSAGIRVGNYKLLMGKAATKKVGWHEVPKTDNDKMKPGKESNSSYVLFDLSLDPIEKFDISLKNSNITMDLINKINSLAKTAMKALPRTTTLDGHPDKFNGAFSTGWCTPIKDNNQNSNSKTVIHM